MSNIDTKIEAVDTPVEQEVKTPEKRSILGVVLRFLKNNFYLYGGPLIAAILGLVIFLFGIVPTGSMEPNYHAGSFFLAYRLIDTDNIERCTPVVFDMDGTVFFKRVIGLPGDTVSFEDGSVYINGEKLDESAYLDASVWTDAGYQQEYVVPAGCYFMMGDNRGNSLDARYWDNPFISADKVKGKVLFTVKIPFWNVAGSNS